MRAAIITPTTGWIHQDLQALHDRLAARGHKSIIVSDPRQRIDADDDKSRLKNISKSRNECVSRFLNTGLDCALWVDSDVVPPDTIIEDLAALDHPFACAWVPIRDSGDWIGGRWLPDNEFEPYSATKKFLVETDLPVFACGLVSRKIMSAGIEFSPALDCSCLNYSTKQRNYWGESLSFGYDLFRRFRFRAMMAPGVFCKHERLKRDG